MHGRAHRTAGVTWRPSLFPGLIGCERRIRAAGHGAQAGLDGRPKAAGGRRACVAMCLVQRAAQRRVRDRPHHSARKWRGRRRAHERAAAVLELSRDEDTEGARTAHRARAGALAGAQPKRTHGARHARDPRASVQNRGGGHYFGRGKSVCTLLLLTSRKHTIFSRRVTRPCARALKCFTTIHF
jgi:hypothetical protein